LLHLQGSAVVRDPRVRPQRRAIGVISFRQAPVGRLRGRSGHRPADNLRWNRRKWPI